MGLLRDKGNGYELREVAVGTIHVVVRMRQTAVVVREKSGRIREVDVKLNDMDVRANMIIKLSAKAVTKATPPTLDFNRADRTSFTELVT